MLLLMLVVVQMVVVLFKATTGVLALEKHDWRNFVQLMLLGAVWIRFISTDHMRCFSAITMISVVHH